MRIMTALVGNQNCGKTTLFNQLTGSNQHVGNFPGVTVDCKEGRIKSQKEMFVVDLPGIYSLSPYTPEEVVSRDFIVQHNPSAIINIVDATNLQRNLYLTLQLLELKKPLVVALNMMDEVRASGVSINIAKLSEELGVPVVPIYAAKNEGTGELVNAVVQVVQKHELPQKVDFCSGDVHKALHATAHLIEDNAKAAGYPSRFAASKLLEGDEPLEQALALSESQLDILQHIVTQMEQGVGMDREAALADMRYQFIENLYATCVHHGKATKEAQRSIQIDRILTHKIWGIPIFIGVMLLIFYLTFDSIGLLLGNLMDQGITNLTIAVDAGLTQAGVSTWMHSFIVDGVLTGVGSVLSFLPVIVVLFFFLSLLEDSGYMARVAFVMDSALRKIGLSGRSFVPMLIGFGCSVPAIMSTRILPSKKDKRLTILIIPFMSCGAKVPIYALFTAAFFTANKGLVMTSLYVLGILVAVLTGLIFKKTLFRGNPAPFVLELPTYRFPSLKSVLMLVWERAKEFIIRAFTIIFLASIVIWFLQSFNLRFEFITDNSQSLLSSFGNLIAPLFAPLGFGNWQAATSLITGLTAKETVISTLSVLTGDAGSFAALFTPLSAYAFMAFTLLYMPCVASVASMRKELGSIGGTLFSILYQTGIAWIIAFIIFQVGSLVLA